MKKRRTLIKALRFGFIGLVCVILAFQLLSGGNSDQSPLNKPEISILERKPGKLIIRIDFPPAYSNADYSGAAPKMGRLPLVPDAAGNFLPEYQLILPGHKKSLSAKIIKAQTGGLILDNPQKSQNEPNFSEKNKPGTFVQNKSKPLAKKNTAKSEPTTGWVTVEDLGTYRRIPLTTLRIRPVRLTSRGNDVTYLKSLTLCLEYPEAPAPGQRRASLPPALQGLSGGLPIPAFAGAPPPPPLSCSSVSQERLKIFVSKEGIYRLNYSYLASKGVNLSSVDPRTLKMENQGSEIPIYVFGEADGRFDEGDYIEFWGEWLHGTYIDQNPEIYSDLYTDVNLYYLSWGGPLGARLVEESGEVVEINQYKMFRATSYPFFVHSEKNLYYNKLSQVSPDSLKENWYYDSGISATENRNYNVTLPYPDDDALINASVRVALQGLTYPQTGGQGGHHHAYIMLNDASSSTLQAGSAGDSWWKGQTGIILDAPESISPTVLNHGNNQLSIFVPEDTYSGIWDTILLNWFQITYQRLYKAYENKIRFCPPQAAVDTLVDFRIDGFNSSQISIYKLGQSKIINAEITPYEQNNATFYKAHFQDRPFGSCEYIALTPEAKLLPDSSEFDEGSAIYNELSSGSPVKLLIITSRLFEDHPDLIEFVERRYQTIGRTELIYIDDVFDEFSYGIYTPQAVKDLVESLPTLPEFLLLVGDASYDTRNIHGFGGNLIPPHYFQMNDWGATISDFYYSQLGEDILPDIAVGRIPARNEQELSDYLQKLEEYDTNPESGAWRSSHLFISSNDGYWVQENNQWKFITFKELSERAVGVVENNLLIERLVTEPVVDPFFGTTDDLIDLFDAGSLIVDYNGHGAGGVWSQYYLFGLDDIARLSNRGKYPLITNFTCFIGAFDKLTQEEVLGEEFVFAPQKGAIGVLASAGLGLFLEGNRFQQELGKQIYDNSQLRIGEIINAAKIIYYAYYGQGGSIESFDTMHGMNLLGDPSLLLAFAETAPVIPQVSPEFTMEGDSVEVVIPGDYADYQGILRVYDDFDYPAFFNTQILEVPLSPVSAGLQANFIMPQLDDSVALIGGTFRMNLWNPANDSTYKIAAPFYLLTACSDSSIIDSLSIYPEPVYERDAFEFRLKIIDAQGIASAKAHFRIERDLAPPVVEHDSLSLTSMTAPNWYQTSAIDTTMYPYTVGDQIFVWVETVDNSGDTTITQEYAAGVILDSRADPEWVQGSLTMGMRDNSAALIAEIINDGQSSLDSLDVSFYRVTPSWQLIGTTILYDLLPGETSEGFVSSNLSQPAIYTLQIQMNDSGWVDDLSPTDPYISSLTADHFSVSSTAGTGGTLTICDTLVILDSSGQDSLTTGAIFQIYIPAGGISGGQGVLTFKQCEDLTISPSQQGLSFALQNNAGAFSGLGFEIELLGSIALVSDSLQLTVDSYQLSNSALAVDDIFLHRQEFGQNSWILLPGEIEMLALPPNPHLKVTASSQKTGSFTLLQNGDNAAPSVEISVEGQIYTEGGYVPNQPKISAVVQDFGGMSTAPGTHWITVDGQVVDSSLISISLDNSGQVLTLSINPTFSVGAHTVSVSALDLSGNLGSASIQFEVTGQFRLDFVGNYPNPFKNKTYFAYRLTEQTTEPVKILIFTVSGRLIRTLYSSSAEEINYAEIYWDGRDEDGAHIANGVYFYKIIARRNGTTIERTMKMAKLR